MKTSGVCLQLAPRLSSDDFFAGLQIVQTEKKREYRKGQIRVTLFPPLIHVDVVIFASDCVSGNNLASAESLPAVKSVTFSAQWKRALQSRTATIKSQTIRKPVIDEWLGDAPKWLLEDQRFTSMVDAAWDVDLQIEDQDVPITDSLIVTASAEAAKQPLRFVARF